MNIGYFTTSFPYKNPITGECIRQCSYGGVEVGTYNLAVEMAKIGNNVSVFTSSIDSKDSIEKYRNINVYRYGKNFTIGSAPISLRLLYKPINYEMDIAHGHLGNLPAPLAAYLYSKKKKKPFVISYHGDYIGGFGGIPRRVGVFLHNKCIVHKLLSSADVVIALSESQVKDSKFLSRYSNKIKIIPDGINLEEFNIPYSKEECRDSLGLNIDEKIILFVGTLYPVKCPDVLLRAVSIVLKDIPNTKLIFMGEGILKEKLIELSKKLGIDKYIKFTGFISDARTKAMYYKMADVFVLPSMSEGFGIVLLEASACGLPLVVSDLGVFKTIVKDEYNGLFTKTGNEKDLADKLIYLLENEDVRERMGKNGRERVKNYSWDKIVEKIVRIYQELGGKK